MLKDSYQLYIDEIKKITEIADAKQYCIKVLDEIKSPIYKNSTSSFISLADSYRANIENCLNLEKIIEYFNILLVLYSRKGNEEPTAIKALETIGIEKSVTMDILSRQDIKPMSLLWFKLNTPKTFEIFVTDSRIKLGLISPIAQEDEFTHEIL